MNEKDQETEYFKEKLFSNFKEAGLLDHLKSQMRYNMLEKLQKRNLAKDSNKENRNTLNQNKENPLSFRVIISIISEFLEYYGYNYTQAVFLPEAKQTNQTLSRNEITEILHLNKIITKEDSMPLLNKIIDFTDRQLDTNKERMSVHCQTDFEGKSVNLEEKLRNVDYEYLQKIDEERISSQQSFEEKFTKFKRDYEMRMKAEMAAEITRIKEFELANIKLDEAEKYRLKMEQYREELDRVYTEKLQKLREREKDTIERCKQQLKALEAASYEYRQKFLKDLEVHKMKEEGLDAHLKLEKESVKMQKERLQEVERDLQKQFKDLEDQKRATLKQNHESKTSKKTDFEREDEEDSLAVIHMKAKLENEISRAEQFKIAAENYESQNKRLLEENAQNTEELKRLRDIKKNLELELEKTKETVQVLKKSLEKDEDHIKLYDKQVQAYQEEIKQYKAATQEYKDMIQQKKREQIESNQKFIKEIEFYQNEIEKLEKERDTLRKRIQDLENEIDHLIKDQAQNHEIEMQKDYSLRNSKRQTNDNKRDTNIRPSNQILIRLLKQKGHLPDSTNRFRYSVISEENEEEPTRKLDDVDRELRELKEKRENILFGYTNASGEKRSVKAHSSSPRFERERFPKLNEELQISPNFRTYFEQDSTDLTNLEKKKQDLKQEIGLDDLRLENSSRSEPSFSLEKKRDLMEPPKSNFQFDQIFDKYADKILQESNSFDNNNDIASRLTKNLGSKDNSNSINKADPQKNLESNKKSDQSIQKKPEESFRVKDIFKVESPKPASHKIDVKLKSDPVEELSQRSNKSLVDSFSEDHPKPFIFTKKEPTKKETEKTLPSLQKSTNKPLEDTKSQPQAKKVEKIEPNDLPSSITSKNLSRLDKPKLGELNPAKNKTPEKLILPSDLGAKNKPKEDLKLKPKEDLKTKPKEEPKKPGQRVSPLDVILGNQHKDDNDIDFEEINEELYDF